MKLHKLILPFVAGALLLNSCYDNKMEWEKPEGEGDVTIPEIPLRLAEQIANYDFIKAYAKQHTPNMTIGIGLGADAYISDPDFRKVANDNFQMITTGNAMKHASIMNNRGEMNFGVVDNFFAALPADMKVYGHTLLWHTQQRAAYLNSIIAPEVIIEPEPGEDTILNMIPNSDFEDGTTAGWGCWGGNAPTMSISAAGEGYESDYAMKLYNPKADQAYQAQAAYTFNSLFDKDETYVVRFMVRADGPGEIQAVTQNSSTYGNQQYGAELSVGTSWIEYEHEFVINFDEVDRIIIQFGKAAETTYYVDNFKFGKKNEVVDPDAHRINLLANGSFGTDISDWGVWNGADAEVTHNADEGNKAAGSLQIHNMADHEGGEWKTQIHADLIKTIPEGSTFYVSYYARTTVGSGSLRLSTTGNAHYQGNQTIGPGWNRYEWEVTAGGDVTGVNIDAGLMEGIYLMDDIIVSLEPFTPATRSARGVTTRGIIEIPKTDEEKYDLILGAMETWIKGMLEHCKERVDMWDVLNEPIGDNGQLRGVDFVPSEVGDQEFYWGQYLGKEYAVKAFQFARKYGKPGDKLFINDYNLEIAPGKLKKLIEYAEYIDKQAGETVVDGIGTQMHLISTAITREQIDEMFKTMAATGKLVRVTELDVRIEGSEPASPITPTAEQLAKQAQVYQWVVESYKENVPTAQQSGITAWSLTDHAREHEYWLKNDAPNLFDANYGRKHAYKGFCDGIAGYDIGQDFDGSDWQSAYPEEEEEDED